jgi:exopolysaccharide biosynthesis polyprenyl glycosylphosphotransferase
MATLYHKPLSKLILFSDFVVLNTALIFARYLLTNYVDFNFQSGIFFLLSNACWLMVTLFNKNHRIYQPVNLNDIIDRFLMTLICQLFILLAIIYFLGAIHISQKFILISFGLFFFLIIAHRVLLYFFLSARPASSAATTRVAVIGDKWIADSLLKSFYLSPRDGYQVDEYISEGQAKRLQPETLLNKLTVRKPDEIFICYRDVSADLLDRLITFGHNNSIRIKVVFDRLNSNKKKGVKHKNAPIVTVNSPSESDLKVRLIKRSFDVSFAFTMMILGLPVFLTLYLITKLTSKGPVFYKQERIGKNERPFYIYKFRSMHVNAEKHGPQLAKDNDPRVTKWGLMMRKTRLDELPQFWNVIRGDMSVVGYRPERRCFIEEISKRTPEYKKLLAYKPGITSLGQVHYGYAENIDQMCERLNYDLLYARSVNFNSDFNIILKTVRIMVEGRGK